MTTPSQHSKPPAADRAEAPTKEPILMNWIIIVVTLGIVGFAAQKLAEF